MWKKMVIQKLNYRTSLQIELSKTENKCLPFMKNMVQLLKSINVSA